MDLLKNKPFLILWFSMFISTAGTFLLLLALSAKYYLFYSKGVLAGSVFAVQWLPAIICYPLVVHICVNYNSRTVLIWAEIFSAVASVLIGFLYPYGYFYVLGMIFIRGCFESLMKSSRFIALKLYISNNELEKATSLFNSSYFLGSFFGGLIGTVVINNLTILEVALIDSGTFLISAYLYSLLDRKENSFRDENDQLQPLQIKGHLNKVLEQFGYYPKIKEYFLYLLIVVSMFQGFHIVARTVIPIDNCGMGAEGVTLYQMVTSLSLIASTLFMYKFSTKREAWFYNPMTLIFISAGCLVLTVLPKDIYPGLASYFLYVFVFEVAYIRYMNIIMLNCSISNIKILIPFIKSCVTAVLALSIIGGGLLIDLYGITKTGIIFSLITIIISLAVFHTNKTLIINH